MYSDIIYVPFMSSCSHFQTTIAEVGIGIGLGVTFSVIVLLAVVVTVAIIIG